MYSVKKKTYEFRANKNGVVSFLREGKEFFTVPASCQLNGVYSDMELTDHIDNIVVYSSASEKMVFELFDDCVVVRYSIKCNEELSIFIAKMFANDKMGMELNGFDRAFCPQPRNNSGKNMDYYHHLPDISQNGYFSPSILEFSLGNADGWVSIGLLDLPDSKIIKMDEDFSFLIESCGGNKIIPAGSEYQMPAVLITFPKDEWDGITVFRNKLMEFGLYTPQKPRYSELPSWWKNPFVCTYGDQMLEKRVGQLIDDKWVEEIINIAECEWGLEHVNLIIDDSWQLPHAFEPIADKSRFPDFRKFIDKLHERGHHVILWQTPLFDKITNGFKTRAQKLGVLSDTEFKGGYFKDFPGCFAIDYTSDNAQIFIKEIVEILFGSGEGQYNADGIKLDFLGLLRDPAVSKYAHPERGMGVKELLHFYELFYQEAKKVKPDVIIDSTAGDPRFEHVLDFNRLHDTHCGTIEKEMRARISSLGCPDLPIDSDGALMFNRWLKVHYISAALYAVPSNYYVKKYHDASRGRDAFATAGVPEERIDLLPEEKKKLGNLFQMVKYRPDGYAELESFGNWVLRDGDKINGITQRGETIVYYPTETCDTGYIYTFQDEVIIIPLHGRKISQLEPAPQNNLLLVDYARDVAIMKLTPGVLHTFKNIDDDHSIDKMFRNGVQIELCEDVMNYVNE